MFLFIRKLISSHGIRLLLLKDKTPTESCTKYLFIKINYSPLFQICIDKYVIVSDFFTANISYMCQLISNIASYKNLSIHNHFPFNYQVQFR